MGTLRATFSKVMLGVRSTSRLLKIDLVKKSVTSFFASSTPNFKRVPLSVQKRLYRQVAIFSCSLFAVMSFAPSHVSFGSFTADPNLAFAGEIVIADADGYLTKLNPQTNATDRSTMSDSLTHVVESGETLSAIAGKYDIKVETLMWENDLYNANALKVGQELIIPPDNGVYHKVKENDTIAALATKYEVDAAAIYKANDLAEDSILSIGEELFVPGAKGVIPSPPVVARDTYSRSAGVSRGYVADTTLPNSDAQPAVGVNMIWPTSGKVTQGYGAYHHALDIAKYPGGPIWAASGGTVVKASSGTYAGGYGNHVIIDHGNGLKTLYAHMEYLSVKVGDSVTQGQVLGKMGNTGRVYGRTGIHLHFEVWKNGVKQNPWNYL